MCQLFSSNSVYSTEEERPGYRQDEDGNWVDIDECAEGIDACPDYMACLNIEGGYYCIGVEGLPWYCEPASGQTCSTVTCTPNGNYIEVLLDAKSIDFN